MIITSGGGLVTFRLCSLDGRGGATALGVNGRFGEAGSGVLLGTVLLVKKDSTLARSSWELPFREGLLKEGLFCGMAIRSTCASRLDSWLGFSLRWARCVAARADGEGGLGDGFMACATASGIVGMLLEDATGS